MPELPFVLALALLVPVLGAIVLNTAHRDRPRRVPVRVTTTAGDLRARRLRYLAASLPPPRSGHDLRLPIGPGRDGHEAAAALQRRIEVAAAPASEPGTTRKALGDRPAGDRSGRAQAA